VHPPLIDAIQPDVPARSSLATLQHKNVTTYGCFLPDLTGFMGVPCGGPCYQHETKHAGTCV